MKPGNIRNVIDGICEIMDGITVILTIGFYHPNLAFKFLCWAESKYLKNLIEGNKNVKND